MTGPRPFVSIVIATYNRAQLLRTALDAFEKLDFPRGSFELIVTDDGSTDNSAGVLAEYAARTPLQFNFATQPNRGPAAARNRGIQVARGELIAFTDDDCVVTPAWLTQLVQPFQDRTIGGVGGTLTGQSRGLVSDYLNSHEVVASNLEGKMVPPFLITANACFRREALEDAGGFDENIRKPGGEDPDLSWRVAALGYRLVSAPDAVVIHHHKAHLREFVRMFYHYGQGARYVAAKHAISYDVGGISTVLRLLGPRAFAYRCKKYMAGNYLPWRDAAVFALLDVLRGASLLAGSRSAPPGVETGGAIVGTSPEHK